MTELVEKKGDPQPGESAGKRWHGLLLTPEGRVLLGGVALALGYLVAMALYTSFRPHMRPSIFAMTASHIMAGRAAGITVGYANDLGHAWVIPVNIIIETFMVMIAYPIFVFSVRRLIVFTPIQSFVARIESAAENHKKRLRIYGIPGLFVFVMFPFWMTGPTVGCAIGYFLGIRTWLNLSIVLAGTYVAVVLWALLLRHAIESLATLSVYGPLVLVVVIAVVAVVGYFLQTDAPGGESPDQQGQP
ncbi:MAG: small multi-drug export protein [Verrucomicrobia bacterium]|nr:small multi-drug export protein [Verrucomicrobiota bacterium]MDA1087779.1 small multi-drug export protein [Verrucomicrobiota bacterium]